MSFGGSSVRGATVTSKENKGKTRELKRCWRAFQPMGEEQAPLLGAGRIGNVRRKRCYGATSLIRKVQTFQKWYIAIYGISIFLSFADVSLKNSTTNHHVIARCYWLDRRAQLGVVFTLFRVLQYRTGILIRTHGACNCCFVAGAGVHRGGLWRQVGRRRQAAKFHH